MVNIVERREGVGKRKKKERRRTNRDSKGEERRDLNVEVCR